MTDRPLILVDGNNHLHADFRATEKDGPSVAVSVFVRRLTDMLKVFRPDKLIVCWDGDSNFRKDLDPEYKANRPEKPEALLDCIEAAKSLLVSREIECPCVNGFEADDVIATLCQAWLGRVVISSTDKDFKQLLERNRVTILKSFKMGASGRDPVWYTKNMYVTEYGPYNFTDYLALAGDNADNIKGAPGIGPKKALKLLDDYGSLKSIFEHMPEHTEAIRRSLNQLHDKLDVIMKLVTMRKDVPLSGVNLGD